MTEQQEQDYQAAVRALSSELRGRADTLVGYLASQPHKQAAMQEALAFGWWCITEGARQADIAIERERRKHLARHGAA